MEKIFNITSSFKALEQADDGSVLIRGMASTDHQDRANDVIRADAWAKGGLENFKNNPIILFNHNYNKPIGRATGVKVTSNGLELEAKISKSAPDSVAELIKEGILGAFSVGFRVKDADYIKETDGLMIKDAELFEVSVVSVPCNQAATFSVAKSFDTQEEYEKFKKTFINNAELAGQSLAKDEANASNIASDAPDEVEKSTQTQETKMSEQNQIDLEAFAKKVADETAAKIAMKQAQEKAAADAEAKKAQEEAAEKAAAEEQVKSTIEFGIQSGAERLMADVEAKLAEKDAKIDEVIKSFSAQLEEKSEELSKMRESKKVFADRSEGSDLSKWGKEFMYAHMLGVMTGKGWNTNYGRDILAKAGATYDDGSTDGVDASVAVGVSTSIEKEIQMQLRLAQAFREVQINSSSQVLPIQPDTGLAAWGINANTSGNLTKRTGGGAYGSNQIVLKAFRLISQTYMDNQVDEEILINLMPMLIESVARAHARSVDSALLNATESVEGFNGLIDIGGNNSVTVLDSTSSNDTSVTAAEFLSARKQMGKYGMMPEDLVYVVSQSRYYDLISDPGFADITDVGSNIATKITGTIGSIYGTPVIVSDNFAAEADGETVGLAVNLRNFVIPRLRGVSVEQDYEVANQRRVIVASQSLGFNQLVADTSTDKSVVKLVRTDS